MLRFVDLFKGILSREQVKTIIYKLTQTKFLDYSGTGSGREYYLGKAAIQSEKLFKRAVELGLEEMRKRGELRRPGEDPDSTGQ